MGVGVTTPVYWKDETRRGSVICLHHTAPVSLPRWGRLATACGGNTNKDIDGSHVLQFTQGGFLKLFLPNNLLGITEFKSHYHAGSNAQVGLLRSTKEKLAGT